MKQLLEGILIIIVVTILLALFLVLFVADANALPDPNAVLAFQILYQHWLDVKSTDSKVFDPNVPVKHVFTVWPCSGSKDDYLVVRCKDPNDSLEVTSFHMNRLNYEDFARFARVYPGDPNHISQPVKMAEPPEPNLAEILKDVNDPVLIQAIKEIYK